MNIEFRENLEVHLYGFEGPVIDGNFGKTGLALSARMWEVVQNHNLPHKGVNIWAYDSPATMFAGVEMNGRLPDNFGLEEKKLRFKRYAWYKHVGSYDLLKEANAKMREELMSRGINYGSPCIEIYGHHDPDVSKLETEVIYAIY